MKRQDDDKTMRILKGDAAKLDSLLDGLDKESPDARSANRRARRYQFREMHCTVTIEHPDSGGATTFSVATRNLSVGGLSFLHSGFVHNGARCSLKLTTLEGEERVIKGTVVRCRYVGDWVHEVSIRFDEKIQPAQFCEEAGQLSVLLIEPDEETASMVAQQLASMRGEVTTTHSAAEAIELVGSHPFDCVLMEVELPEDGGVELIAKLREQCFGGPIVVVTKSPPEGDAPDAESDDRTRWLAKPYTPEMIKGLVDELRLAA